MPESHGLSYCINLKEINVFYVTVLILKITFINHITVNKIHRSSPRGYSFI